MLSRPHVRGLSQCHGLRVPTSLWLEGHSLHTCCILEVVLPSLNGQGVQSISSLQMSRPATNTVRRKYLDEGGMFGEIPAVIEGASVPALCIKQWSANLCRQCVWRSRKSCTNFAWRPGHLIGILTIPSNLKSNS